MSRITTVIFDVYETLAENNAGLWIETFARICREQGLEVGPRVLYQEWKAPEMMFRKERLNLEEPEKSPPFKSYYQAWRDCFTLAFSALGLKGDASAAATESVRDMGLREPYADAMQALPAIQARWSTGVLSNADDGYLLPLLDRIGWKFDAVLSSEMVHSYKPQAAPFRQVLHMLDVPAWEAVYVGDTQFDDVLGASGVGMRTVWVNRKGASPDPHLPELDRQVESLTELPGILEEMS